MFGRLVREEVGLDLTVALDLLRLAIREGDKDLGEDHHGSDSGEADLAHHTGG